MTLLDVRNLAIRYPGGGPAVVSDVSFRIARGESLGLVGESGSGKTQTALALMGLLPASASVHGSVRIDGEELLGAAEDTLNRYRPCRMAMVFQDPREALNPYLRIGEQLARILIEHRLAARRDVPARVATMLQRVGLPDAARQMHAYPHQLSGGMRQRAMIAAALLGKPDLLIADEPTTALDVTVQAQILELLRGLRRQFGSALLLITHDLGVIAGNCERMLVINDGQLVEEGMTSELFARPRHARTRALIEAAPRLADIPAAGAARADGAALLRAARVDVSYFHKAHGALWRHDEMRAVRDVTLELRRGETLAVVGESGSGKTSLARALLGLLPLAGGSVSLTGRPLAATLERRPPAVRRELQLVFQDPAGSLDPSMPVGRIVAEPLEVHAAELDSAARRDAVEKMLGHVGLTPALLARYPHELSGGQAQRVAIARALIVQPSVLICDEAVAALDGTVRREILDLLAAEQERSGLALLFISHDLSVVKRISHRVMVLYMGRVCEVADGERLFRRPRHPYTRALIDSVPSPDPAVPAGAAEIRGEVASLAAPPPGCVFHPRCRYAVAQCRSAVPLLEGEPRQSAACHRAAELDLTVPVPAAAARR